MEQTTLLLLGLGGMVLLLAVAVLVLLLRQGSQSRELRELRTSQEQMIRALGDSLLDEMDATRQDTEQTLQALGDRLMATQAQLGQSQQALLESAQRQQILSARSQEERFSQMSAALTQNLTQLDARLAQYAGSVETLRRGVEGQLTALRQDNDRQLGDIRRTVDEKLQETLDKRLNDSFAQVSARLEQVYKGLGEMQTLASGVGDLKKVLTNVKTRGIWGEMQAGSVLSEVLTRDQYGENVEVVPGSGERVEFAVKLPGRASGQVWLPIDSKFPQESYLRLVDASQAGDLTAVSDARRELRLRILQEGKRIATKYVSPPHSTDFAIMFLPVEGLYAEVMQEAGLSEELQRTCRVVVAGPSTFAALLNSLQMGFRTLAIEQRSSEVWQLLGAVKNDFGRFAETLEKTRQRLRQATESIDTAFTRTRTIQRRLGEVEQTDATLFPAGDLLAESPETPQDD